MKRYLKQIDVTEGKRNQKQEGSEVKTFPISFTSGGIKENFSINTNTPHKPSKPLKPSKEQIINQAIQVTYKRKYSGSIKMLSVLHKSRF